MIRQVDVSYDGCLSHSIAFVFYFGISVKSLQWFTVKFQYFSISLSLSLHDDKKSISRVRRSYSFIIGVCAVVHVARNKCVAVEDECIGIVSRSIRTCSVFARWNKNLSRFVISFLGFYFSYSAVLISPWTFDACSIFLTSDDVR